MSLSPGTKLGAYEILSPIGAGGMGEVYRAHDSKLGRDVAIKVLPEELASDRDRLRRFEQEARAASALNHPNIVTIHDIAEEGPTHYIVMEYIKGKTFRELIDAGTTPTRKLLEVATQIGEGLAKAHAAGIVHRDLKPENLMVSEDGFVKILDFGLAKLAPHLPAAGSDAVTVTKGTTTPGTVIGTVGYMSPEQAKGVQADYRSDQFSLGTILYEMASGKRAFERETGIQTLSAIIENQPRPIAELAAVPPYLSLIITRCLSKDPSDRYDSTRDLARELKSVQVVSSDPATGEREVVSFSDKDSVRITRGEGRLKIQIQDGSGGEHIQLDVPERGVLLPLAGILIALLVVAIGFNLGGVRDRLFGGSTKPPRIESIAVLPLDNLSGDPAQEYFADGMTEALIADLAKISSLKVISRTSVMQYKGIKRSLQEIADELDVDAIIEGSAMRAGDRVRITAQLIDAKTDRHLWAESYERDVDDVISLQSEVARAIAQEIEITVTPTEAALLSKAESVNPLAHEAYLRGRFEMSKGTEEGYERSIVLLEQALEKDPDYALAHVAIAEAYFILGVGIETLPLSEAIPKARDAAKKALEIDANLADAHATLASIKYIYDWVWTDAEGDFQRAIELNPSSSYARLNYAYFLSFTERHDEAIAQSRRAREVDPLNLQAMIAKASVLYYARRYDEALDELGRALEIDPDFLMTHHVLSWTYQQKGMWKEKIAADQRVLTLSGDSPQEVAGLADAYAESGVEGFWTWFLERLQKRAVDTYYPGYLLAGIYAQLGDFDHALESLEVAYQQREPGLAGIRVNPWFDPLRSDTRYEELVQRMNFPE